MTQDSSPSVAFHPAASRRALLFGPFRFDLSDKTLSRDGEEIRLPPRALLILDYLIERPGRIVGKQELIDAVWKDAFVGESSLTEAIGVLRQALGDSADKGEYIQTVHRRGYRFVAALGVDAQAGAQPFVPVLAPQPAPSSPAVPSPAPSRSRARFGLIAIVVLAAIAAAAAAAWMYAGRASTPEVTRATITLPVEQAPAPGLTARTIAALSPDGRRIVYVAGAPGSYRLFLRAIDQFEAIPVPGSDGAHAPFFSPDGASIGYFSNGRLFVMRLPDGQPIDLAAAGNGEGGWWHTDGTILFATGRDEGLYRINATGGERRPISIAGFDGATLRNPMLLEDGKTVVATAWKLTARHSEVVALDTESGTARTIARGVHPRMLPDGRVIYLRDGELVAAPFEGGPETTLISAVMSGVAGAGQYALAANGTLIYMPEHPERLLRRLARITETGEVQPLVFEPRPYQNANFSPDGTRIVTTIYERGASDLWIGDVERGVIQRLTSEGGTVDPVWSRDGASIYFGWARPTGVHVHRMPVDGSAPPQLVSTATPISPRSVTRDGVVFGINIQSGGRADILTIAPDGTSKPWLATWAAESNAQLSPDERFVAYQSDKSGRVEIYVRPASGGAPEQQVSVEGGTRPGWSADSRAILFSANRHLYRAAFDNGKLSRPVEIHADNRMVMSVPGPAGTLAIMAIAEERPLTTFNLVVGWTSEVRNRR